MAIDLVITKRTDLRLLKRMGTHYSQPKGFVGRNICYAILYDGIYYGHIVAGSSTRFLPGRNEYLGMDKDQLNEVINNIFYSISKVGERYPCRNFTSKVLKEFMRRSFSDWFFKYGDLVIGFETLVEKPRTGDLYKKAGWEYVGETKGFSCKRVSGRGSDPWSGRRVWNTDPEQLRPKSVFCYGVR